MFAGQTFPAEGISLPLSDSGRLPGHGRWEKIPIPPDARSRSGSELRVPAKRDRSRTLARQRVKDRLPARAWRAAQREAISAQVLFGGSFLRSGINSTAISALT